MNLEEFYFVLNKLIHSNELRTRFGNSARKKVELDFSVEKINEENYKSNNWLDFNSKSIPEIIANNEIVFLDLIKPSIIFYSIDTKILTKLNLKLKKPLGNVYPLNDNNFIISSYEGMHIYNRKKNALKYFI